MAYSQRQSCGFTPLAENHTAELFWWCQCNVRYYGLPLPPPPGILVPASTSGTDSVVLGMVSLDSVVLGMVSLDSVVLGMVSLDSVVLGMVSFSPHLLVSRSPPVPLVVTV